MNKLFTKLLNSIIQVLLQYNKFIAFGFWFISITITLLVLTLVSIQSKGSQIEGLLFLTLLILGFFVVSFIVGLPNWLGVFLILSLLFAKKKIKSYNPLLLSAISNLLILLAAVILYTSCEADKFCRTSDTPLGGVQGWSIGFMLGNFFWTLPFTYLMKMILKIFGTRSLFIVSKKIQQLSYKNRNVTPPISRI